MHIASIKNEVVGWLGHGFRRPEAPAPAAPAPPPTVEELKIKLDMMRWLNEQTRPNGQ